MGKDNWTRFFEYAAAGVIVAAVTIDLVLCLLPLVYRWQTLAYALSA